MKRREAKRQGLKTVMLLGQKMQRLSYDGREPSPCPCSCYLAIFASSMLLNVYKSILYLTGDRPDLSADMAGDVNDGDCDVILR